LILVYATGTPRDLEFHLAQDRKALPQHATVYAICKDGRCDESLDEYTFSTMTDVEYYEFQACVNQAQRIEAQRLHHARNCNLFYRVLGWLNALLISKPLMDTLPDEPA